jgi:hypothetical protein
MKRLYLGDLLRSVSYSPAYPEYDMPETYRIQLVIGTRLYLAEGPTFDDVISQLKQQGFQIWGQHPMDYFRPHTAAEKWLYDFWAEWSGETNQRIKTEKGKDSG